MPRVSEATAALLERRREALNARFVRLGRGRDTGAFLAYLARTVDPIVAALSASGTSAARAAGEAVLLALFDLGLVPAARALVADQEASAFERALVEQLPRFAAHLERAPAELVAALANGYDQLSRELGAAQAQRWLWSLAEVSLHCSTRRGLLEAGLAITWREGLAEARAAVLGCELPAPVCNALFGVPLLEREPHRRFCTPGSSGLGPLEIVAQVGGFVGFGGCFRRPPALQVAAGHILARDDRASFELHADVFGARIRPAPSLQAAADGGDVIRLDAEGRLTWSAQGELCEGVFPALAGASSVVACQGVAAVSLPSTHLVFVLGRREARA